MGCLDRSAVSLRIIGEELEPAEISLLLGCAPTYSRKKGDTTSGPKPHTTRKWKEGMWSLRTDKRSPENVEAQILEVLAKLTDDLVIWHHLSKRFKIDLFCGLFMASNNDGMELSPSTLQALGERGIALSLDIYDAGDD